jgi:WD40 repeat protein
MRQRFLWFVLFGLLIYHPALAQSTQQPLLTIPHESTIAGARWHPNGRDFWTWNRIFFQTDDGTTDYQDQFQLWNGDTGNREWQLLYRGDNVEMKLDWSAGEDRLLVYSSQSLEIWDALRGEKTFQFDYSARISGAQWSADFSRILFWSYDDGTIHIWDTNAGEQVFLAETQLNSDLVEAAWSPNERTILAVLTQSPGSVEVWDVASGQKTRTFEYPTMIYDADWNGDGSSLLIVGDKTMRLIDLVTQGIVLEKRDDPYLYRWNWSPDRKWLAVRVENDPRVEVWGALTGTAVSTIAHSNQTDNHIFEVLWSSDNQQILTHSPGEIALWDILSGANLFQIIVEAHAFNMSWLSWSPDETKLIYMRSDSSLQVVMLDTHESVELELPSPIPLSFPNPTFAWNGDSSQVMLWWVDNAARVWDTTSGELLATLEHPVDEGFDATLVMDAICSPDEQYILTLGTPDYCGGRDTCPAEANVWHTAATDR